MTLAHLLAVPPPLPPLYLRPPPAEIADRTMASGDRTLASGDRPMAPRDRPPPAADRPPTVGHPPTADRPPPAAGRPPVAADVAVTRLMKKRLADRLYQRRHRAKREQLTRELETAVQALHEQIAHLRARREAAAARVGPPGGSPPVRHGPADALARPQLHAHAFAVAGQFLRVFGAPHASLAAREQFLRLVLAPHVDGVDVCGADGFVRQLRLYARCCPAFALEPARRPPRVRPAGELAVVDADVTLRLRFCPQRVADLFPRLRTLPPALAARLAGPLVSPGLVVDGALTLVFDRSGVVASLVANLRLLDALRAALGSLADAALLADGARIAMASGAMFADADGALPQFIGHER